MLSKKHKGVLELETNKFVETLMTGNYKTHFKNNGIEFADFREYQPGDDAKKIDFISSAKTGKTLVKLGEEQRELDVYFLPFFGEDIDFEFGGISKREIFEELLFILGISTVKNQNKIASVYYNKGKKQFFPLGKNLAHFYDYFHKIEQNNFGETLFQKKGNISEKLEYFNSLEIKNSLVFLYTSELEIDEKVLKIASLKNDIVVCNVFHSFENSLDSENLVGLSDSNNELFIDLKDEEKKAKYRKLRKQKVIDFRKKVRKSGASYLYFDEKVNIFAELYTFFKNR